MKRKAILVPVIALFVAVLLVFVASRMMKQETSVKLPQTIAEYRSTLNQPDFGMYFLDFSSALSPPAGISPIEDARLHLHEIVGRRTANMGSTESIGNFVANYSAVARKRISFGRRWREVTNSISYDDSKPRTRHETLRLMEAMLATNGGFVFPLDATNVVLLTEKDLEDLGQRIPSHTMTK